MTTAILFDVDGTLIDSNDAHARTWVAALAEAGYQVAFARIRPLIGMGGDRILPLVAPGVTEESAAGKAITKRRVEIFKETELPTIRPTAGARKLLAAVRRRGARVVVASSAKGAELDDLLARGDFAPLVDITTTSDDADSSKPAPDIVGAALAKARVAPGETVLIGDTQYDIEAAHRAHVACVALRCGGNDVVTLRDAEAVYGDPAELADALDRPPFALPSAASTAR